MTVSDGIYEDRLRPMCEQDLPLVLVWRNHQAVRRYMFSTNEIAMDEHRSWFERSAQDAERHLLIYEKGELPLGFVNLHIVDSAGGLVEWGFYVSPDAPLGAGTRLGKAVTSHVFGRLGLHKLFGQVLKYNRRSLRLHMRLGFQQEGVLREHHFDGSGYHDLVCFGLLRSEWTKNHE